MELRNVLQLFQLDWQVSVDTLVPFISLQAVAVKDIFCSEILSKFNLIQRKTEVKIHKTDKNYCAQIIAINYVTRLPSNVMLTMQWVKHGHLQSHDKDGSHTMRSAEPRTTCYRQTSWLYILYNRNYCWLKFYIAGIRIFDVFCSCDLELDPVTFIWKTGPVSPGDIPDVQIRTSYVKAFESYRLTEKQINRHDWNYIILFCLGWSIKYRYLNVMHTHSVWLSKAVFP